MSLIVDLFKICGKYIKGLGKASRFIASEPYFSLFKSILSSAPYPGTLNLRLSGFNTYRDLASRCGPYKIYRDLVYRGRVFGGLTIWIGYISTIKVVVLRPHRSIHPDNIVEIVASQDIRDLLNIDYESEVCIYINCY